MYVELHNCLGEPESIDATRVVVFDDHDNPIAFTVKLGDGTYYSARLGDPEFNDMLRFLGIDRTVITTIIEGDKLKPLPT